MGLAAPLPESWQPYAKDGRLHFDETLHAYYLDGQRVPSVTQVLSLAGLVDLRDIPPHILETARLKGEYVHRATEFHDQGDLDVDTLDPALAGYVAAWDRCKLEHDIAIVDVERPVHWADGEIAFAGTLDRFVACDLGPAIIDLKSGSRLQPTTALQLAAYDLGLGRQDATHRIGVRLCGDGTYEWKPYPHHDLDRAVFLSALRIAHWRLRHGAKIA